MAVRVLILTGDAGFGHRRAARAIQSALALRYGEAVVSDIINPLNNPDIPTVLRLLEQGYDDIVTEGPTFYDISYAATDSPVMARLIRDVTTSVLDQAMLTLFEEYQPDAVVLTYPWFTQPVLTITQASSRHIPVGVVVTDLIGVHSLWFHPGVDFTFVPSTQVYQQALEHNLSPRQIVLTGLPVDPHIVQETRDKATIRTALGWKPDVLTALVVGSSRSRQTASVVSLLDRSGLPLQIVGVSGGDRESEARFETMTRSDRVITYGMVNNLTEMMAASDFIICKAGGLIVTESLAVGLPLILTEALPGQETGNVRFVVESGAGVWSPEPIGALATAYNWLAKDRSRLDHCSTAAKRVGKPHAAYDIAQVIIEAVQQKS